MLRWIALPLHARRATPLSRGPLFGALVMALSFTSSGCKSDTASDATSREQASRSTPEPEKQKIGVTCRAGHEIDAAMHAAVQAEARRVYEDARAGRSDDVWNALHPRALIEDKKAVFMEALQSMHGRLQGIEDEPMTDTVHVIEVRGGADDLARVSCEGTGTSEGFTIYTHVADEDLAVVMLRTSGGPFGLAATVQLRKHGEQWRLVGIQVNPVSYKDRDALAWEAIADAYWRSDKPMPAYLALGVAQTLSTRGASIQTESKDRINEKLEALRSDKGFAEDTAAWTVGGQRYELAGVSLASTQTDISPVVKYVSPGSPDREALELEADTLADHLRGLHPELAEVFDAIVFEAYAERPTTPGKSYDAYRLVRRLDAGSVSPKP
jgi:hypothetical protein